ncbi:hypothetical protein B0A48_05261 [Cryoendolithus antarcticus]|uniref:Transcription factor Iwr1 domain-containing protein n=1 Tax=Cryoendolithus antarcticus TaxID=1507870 RepID=A0A1V8TI18_9PEZI|nr:hypothetical protein B0A48_05261 [Cryoendolithus antarcticus]
MNGPGVVRLQRRRDELPPDALFVERRSKRKLEAQEDDESTHRLKYIRKQDSIDICESASNAGTGQSRRSSFPALSGASRRVFHLKQSNGVRSSQRATSARYPAHSSPVIATVVEQRAQTPHVTSPVNSDATRHVSTPPPLKRAGRGTAPRTGDAMQLSDAPQPSLVHSQLAAERKKFELLAQDAHLHALEEIAKTPRPEVKAKPRLSGARAKALHEARQSQTPEAVPSHLGDAMDVGPDSDHVFDTYILAANDVNEAMDDALEPQASHENIGYLVISEDNEKLWEELMEQEEDVDLEADDEEDENAEDHYGADYPSDELASEDEFDRGAYGYRHHVGSDDEQYDKAHWSDEDNAEALGDDLAGKGMPAQFAKYLAFKNRNVAISADNED